MIKPEATVVAMREGRITLLIEPVRDRHNGKPPLRPGRRYPVQQRRQKEPLAIDPRTERPKQETATVGFVTVKATARKHVWEATDAEAKAAGFRHGIRQLWDHWKDAHDITPILDGIHYDSPAWFIDIRWVHERYLAEASSRPPDEHGYQPVPSRGVMQDAGAAVPEDFQGRISRGELPSDGQRAYDAERAREREQMARKPLAEQLADELDRLRSELWNAPEYEPRLERELKRVRRLRRRAS